MRKRTNDAPTSRHRRRRSERAKKANPALAAAAAPSETFFGKGFDVPRFASAPSFCPGAASTKICHPKTHKDTHGIPWQGKEADRDKGPFLSGGGGGILMC